MTTTRTHPNASHDTARDADGRGPDGLEIVGLSVRIPLPGTPRRWVHAAHEVTLSFPPGEVTAIVGESGCGKSVLALAATGLLPAGTRTRGSIRTGQSDVLAADERELALLRGAAIGLVPQSAATHLTPVRTIGSTVAEALSRHGRASTPGAITALLDSVQLPADTARRYPHEISGGMAQRVLVALTCALEPPVLVGDEPTSALDADSAAVVLQHLRDRADQGSTVLLITHDLIAARDWADRVAVMYAGRILEHGPARTVLTRPAHDYTAALLAALPENGLVPPPGSPSSLVDPDPTGCAWHTRVGQPCAAEPLRPLDEHHLVACGAAADGPEQRC